MSEKKAVIITDGKVSHEYPDLTSCAKSLGVQRTTLTKAISKGNKCRGWTIKVQNTTPSKKPVIEIIQESDLQRQVTRLKERERMLTQTIEELYTANKFIRALDDVVPATIKIQENKGIKHEATAITMLSDVHAEETVSRRTMNGLNEYNLTIAEARVKTYFSKMLRLINYQRQEIKVDNLVLALLGDFISGSIHQELLENNSLSPIEASMFVESLLIGGIKMLAEEGNFKQIIIVGVTGNHSRTTDRKRFSTGFKNSYEYWMYRHLEKLFGEHMTGYNNVKFVIPEGPFAIVEVYDKRYAFSHGDHFKYRGGVGGIEIPLKSWMMRKSMNNGERIDYRVIGHWHHYTPGTNFLVNGSVKGYDPMAYDLGFEFEKPMQHLQFHDKRFGWTDNRRIFLE